MQRLKYEIQLRSRLNASQNRMHLKQGLETERKVYLHSAELHE